MPDRQRISLDEGGATVDAALIAEGLELDAATVDRLIREGALVCRFEKGVGADEGRSRLTFRMRGRAGDRECRLVVDADGVVLNRFRTRLGRRP